MRMRRMLFDVSADNHTFVLWCGVYMCADLQRDAYPVLSNERPTRCTGTALQVAEALMAASVPPGSCAARIMLFTGGPCTEGMGKIINKDLAEEIRRYSSSGSGGCGSSRGGARKQVHWHLQSQRKQQQWVDQHHVHRRSSRSRGACVSIETAAAVGGAQR
jgi:hypothetical protein